MPVGLLKLMKDLRVKQSFKFPIYVLQIYVEFLFFVEFMSDCRSMLCRIFDVYQSCEFFTCTSCVSISICDATSSSITEHNLD